MTLNFRNRTLYHGDNLDFLRGMNSETIDLVATDPPFNKGRDFHATPDSLAAGARFHDRWSWEDDVEGEWVDQIKDDWPAVWEVIDAASHTWGRDMGAFLCYMGVRLIEMHRLLKSAGSLYLHCDDTASAYLMMMLDAIFGRTSRRALITWERQQGGKGGGDNWGRSADTILYYAKGRDFTWHPLYGDVSESTEKAYSKRDEQGRRYHDDNVSKPDRNGYHYSLGLGEKTPSGGYRMPKETALRWLEEGRLIVREGRVPQYRRYYEESRGAALTNIWTDVNGLRRNNDESTGYPTQKPVALYKRIILASSNPGDIVLDPFCGCATTLIAAEQEGRQWIGMDLWDEALTVVQERVEKECANLFGGAITYAETPPLRTDDGLIAAPPLKTKRKGIIRTPEPGPVLPRDEMVAVLLEQQEGKCAGCNRKYDDPLIWEIDHRVPRSEGGVNHHSNRCLLCPPCNRIKSNTLTLSGLQKENQRRKRMVT